MNCCNKQVNELVITDRSLVVLIATANKFSVSAPDLRKNYRTEID